MQKKSKYARNSLNFPKNSWIYETKHDFEKLYPINVIQIRLDLKTPIKGAFFDKSSKNFGSQENLLKIF